MSDLRAFIQSRAHALGFSVVRFTPMDGAPGIAHYDAFLRDGHQGQMDWMARSRPPRADPRQLLPSAQTAVVLAVDYAWPRPPDPGGLTGKVSAYAWGRDYHNLLTKRLRRLARETLAEAPGTQAYWGVDSRPLIERAWAERSGMGFIGKNCCTIRPGQTSYMFLSILLLSAAIPPDPPLLRDHCGRCSRCLEACPTDAFVSARRLDARRCISYLTIEHRGPIPLPLRPGLGRWVFGCDLCQEVCPHNHRLQPGAHEDFQPRTGHAWLDLPWLLSTAPDALMAHFQGSPIKRPGPMGLKRNAAVVLGNLGDAAARPVLLSQASHPDDSVRESVRWALDQLG